MEWVGITAPPNEPAPAPMTVRAQSIAPRHEFREHAHAWNQVVYAVSGVLTVAVEGRAFVISPEQAIWLPVGHRHRVGSLLGAEFRSLWIAADAGRDLPDAPSLVAVSPLLQALIVEAAALQGGDDPDGYAGRVTTLILDQLRRAPTLANTLPWPRSAALTSLCEALYADPADGRGPDEWGKALGMSGRTLARRLDAELGMSLRSWRRRVRLFRAIEMLGGGRGVTKVAMSLGYSSTSAFVYAFRTELGRSPGAYAQAKCGRP